MKHTALPWAYIESTAWGPSVVKAGSAEVNAKSYVAFKLRKDDAAYIVQCCNAFPDLLEACKALYEHTADYIRINHLSNVHHNQCMRMARDAIAKAGAEATTKSQALDQWNGWNSLVKSKAKETKP